MKRSWGWFLLPLFGMALVILRRGSGVALLQDSDTAFLLLKLGERKNPLSWFWTDWPLENHFYRPVSTLAFELDRALYGTHSAGYGLTQALIAALCIALATWMLVELTESVALGCLAGGLFGLWTAGEALSRLTGPVALVLPWLCVLGLLRGKGKWKTVLPALFAVLFWCAYSSPPQQIYGRIVNWLPGRTASVMAIFCFAAVACYARWERLGAEKVSAQPTSEDIPATKGTAAMRVPKASLGWAIGALASTVLALASYEQAVMVPAVLTGVWIVFRLRGYRPRWWVPAASWVLLVGYAILRRMVIPDGPSRYQSQQLRYGPGVFGSLIDFLFPGLGQGITIYNTLEGFPFSYFMLAPWNAWALLVGNGCLAYLAWKGRDRWNFVAAWLMAFVSFLPMAWLKMFEHYYFWPSAYFAWAVVVGGQVVGRSVLSALSPPELAAPVRDEPAPGSL